MKSRLIVLAAALGLLVSGSLTGAMAQMYLNVQGGATFVDSADSTITNGINGPDFRTRFDTGYNVSAALGFRFIPALRTEIEAGFRKNDFDEAAINGPSTSLGGDVMVWSGMLNVFFDFVNPTNFTPYIGGGAGWAWVDADLRGPAGASFDERDDVWAWQIGGGASMAINPQMALVLDYRYFVTDDPEFTFNGTAVETEYTSHNVALGLRFNF